MQGTLYPDLREKSANDLVQRDARGFAIGGLRYKKGKPKNKHVFLFVFFLFVEVAVRVKTIFGRWCIYQ